MIPFEMVGQGHVRISVHDLLGREIAVLVDGVRGPGPHEVEFDVGGLSTGIYFYRMVAFGGTVTRRMVVRE
ncbi:MAG: T9SS type A sorting domain-containing protein [Rhodothermales bacterium]